MASPTDRCDGAHALADAVELARLQARIHELEEALQPFAGVQFFSDAVDHEVWQLEVTVGDLRRAREALYGRPRGGRG